MKHTYEFEYQGFDCVFNFKKMTIQIKESTMENINYNLCRIKKDKFQYFNPINGEWETEGPEFHDKLLNAYKAWVANKGIKKILKEE